jgi:hypothetical protein
VLKNKGCHVYILRLLLMLLIINQIIPEGGSPNSLKDLPRAWFDIKSDAR